MVLISSLGGLAGEKQGDCGGEVGGESEVWFGRRVVQKDEREEEDDEGIWGVEGQRMILSESGQE